MNNVYHYHAYGLHICSDFLIQELEEAPVGRSDLVVRRAKIDRPPDPPRQLRVVEFGTDEQYLGFLAIGRYLIRGDSLIEVDLYPGFDENLIGFSLLGPVMAVVLHLRSIFTLHGSAAEIDGKAVIFLGDKGAGKSTTIGAVGAAGHPVLTDDVVAIAGLADEKPMLLPAFPMIKLTDLAIKAFKRVSYRLIETNIPNFDKRRVRLTGTFATGPVAPRSAFVLVRGDIPAIEPLSAIDGYQALLRYSYATRFGAKLIHGPAAATHMKNCAMLTQHISIARLIVPEGLDRLEDVVSLVERSVL